MDSVLSIEQTKVLYPEAQTLEDSINLAAIRISNRPSGIDKVESVLLKSSADYGLPR